MSWETVIGFEIHTELLTESKVWCGCSTAFGQPPNTQVCPVCLGLPGSLPVLNRRALELAMRASLALGCRLAPVTQFERKNYYYPDLPKNYQISQLRKNLAEGGAVEFDVDGRHVSVRINNIHLEEDAGKNLHPEIPGVDYSLVDLNRAGTPLLEIVTEPDLRSAEEARVFMETLKAILEYTGVSDCNMHEGRLRFEANVSVRRKGDERLGTKVEIKNLNSMKTVLKCIEVETERQIEILEEGGKVVQETRLWDEAAGVTRAMRSKEVAHDYRYFPDPDPGRDVIDNEWNRTRARGDSDCLSAPSPLREHSPEEYDRTCYGGQALAITLRRPSPRTTTPRHSPTGSRPRRFAGSERTPTARCATTRSPRPTLPSW